MTNNLLFATARLFKDNHYSLASLHVKSTQISIKLSHYLLICLLQKLQISIR